MTRFAELDTDDEWEAGVPLLTQLWSHEDESFVRPFREEDDYRLLGLYEGGALVAVAGVSVQRVLHHARHAWVHDLVVDEPRRSEGFGAELLDHLEAWARERDCEYLVLASRLGNEEAMSFYEDNGLERWGYVVETEL